MQDHHERVTNKYDFIYSRMQDHWNVIKESQNLSIVDKLDFISHAWGSICKNNLDVSKNFQAWKGDFENTQVVYEYQNEKKVQVSRLEGSQSNNCISYVFNSTNFDPDIVIELGGGCGHNLIRILENNLFKSDKIRYFVNAEYNSNGIELSKNIFEYVSQASKTRCSLIAHHFDYYKSLDFFSAMSRDFLKDKKVLIFSLTSIEQIPTLPNSFIDFLRSMSESTESLSVVFCEPISFQVPTLINSRLLEQNKQLAINLKHNLNLVDLVASKESQSAGISVKSFVPSIFRIKDGLDISGLALSFK